MQALKITTTTINGTEFVRTVHPDNTIGLCPVRLSPDILALALEGISGQTLRAYQADWRHFAAWQGKSDAEQTCRDLVAGGQGNAQRVLYAYRQALINDKASPSTINRHLASLRYLIRSSRRAGIIDWAVDVQGVKCQTLRDTRGPGAAGMARMLDLTTDPQEHLVLRLLHDMALRRAEVVSLRLEDYKPLPIPPRLWVLAKGKTEREGYTTPSSVITAIERWLTIRGTEPGSLCMVSYQKVARLVQKAAIRAGILSAHPHGLRHAGITAATKKTNGNARKVQKFARHANFNTTLRYLDDAEDSFGEVAEMVGKD